MLSKFHSAECIVSINGSQRILKWTVRYFSNDILAKTLAKTFYKSTYEKTLWQTVCVTALCSKVWPHCYENDKSIHELPIYALWKVKVSIEHTYHIIFNWTAERWHTFKKRLPKENMGQRNDFGENTFVCLTCLKYDHCTQVLISYHFLGSLTATGSSKAKTKGLDSDLQDSLLLCSQIFVLYVWV